jgi:hypothetical protein
MSVLKFIFELVIISYIVRAIMNFFDTKLRPAAPHPEQKTSSFTNTQKNNNTSSNTYKDAEYIDYEEVK